jgi:hypothetical protein
VNPLSFRKKEIILGKRAKITREKDNRVVNETSDEQDK